MKAILTLGIMIAIIFLGVWMKYEKLFQVKEKNSEKVNLIRAYIGCIIMSILTAVGWFN